MTKFKTLTAMLVMALLSILSCKKEDNPPPLSSENQVVSFTASNSGVSSMPVTIDNDKHWITILAVCPTNQDAITVTPVVSEKATSSLAAGTVLDLHGTKKFTVTAENGTVQEYSVFVQGCSLYSSHIYPACDVYREIDCIVQGFGDTYIASQDGADINIGLHFKELPNPYILEGDYYVGFTISNTQLGPGAINAHTISPLQGQDSKATFIYLTNVLAGVFSPSGTVAITSVDTENRLVSGWFNFTQHSNNCSSNSDLAIGEFYSIPY